MERKHKNTILIREPSFKLHRRKGNTLKEPLNIFIFLEVFLIFTFNFVYELILFTCKAYLLK